MVSEKKGIIAMLALFVAMVPSLVFAQDYEEEKKASGCKCQEAIVLKFVGTDYPQEAAPQDADWVLFKQTYPGLVDADRLGNETRTYNCHAYIFIGKKPERWLNGNASARGKFLGDTSGCWKVDPTGDVKSSSGHSMTAGGEGTMWHKICMQE